MDFVHLQCQSEYSVKNSLVRVPDLIDSVKEAGMKSVALTDDMSSIDVLRATFPAGTLSGAPKVRAMEIIDEVETLKRNIYSGAIGNLSWHGGMDLAIAIRTAIVKNDVLYVQAGAGIVHDSVPEMEWQETMDKAQALIRAAQNI